MTMLQITALMDDTLTGRKDLMAEHGLSLHICRNGRQLLFDCGSSGAALDNAQKLGIDLRKLDGVVLSHAHYDHAAGFRFLVQKYPEVQRLYTGPGFFEPKYARNENCYANLSAGFDRRFLEEHGISHQPVTDLQEIFPGVYAISGFPRLETMETIPERFVRRTEAGFAADDFHDELCLALETGEGVVLLVGCAHPGIVNMVRHVHRRLGKPVRAVFGGTHLAEADDRRVQLTVDALQRMGVTLWGLSHCSGERAACAIRQREGIQSCRLGPGDCVFFD